jgi:hypothetical protein
MAREQPQQQIETRTAVERIAGFFIGVATAVAVPLSSQTCQASLPRLS